MSDLRPVLYRAVAIVLKWASYLAVFAAGLIVREAVDDWTLLGRSRSSVEQVDVALDSGGGLLIIDRRTGTYDSYDLEVTRSVVNMYTAFLSDPEPVSK